MTDFDQDGVTVTDSSNVIIITAPSGGTAARAPSPRPAPAFRSQSKPQAPVKPPETLVGNFLSSGTPPQDMLIYKLSNAFREYEARESFSSGLSNGLSRTFASWGQLKRNTIGNNIIDGLVCMGASTTTAGLVANATPENAPSAILMAFSQIGNRTFTTFDPPKKDRDAINQLCDYLEAQSPGAKIEPEVRLGLTRFEMGMKHVLTESLLHGSPLNKAFSGALVGPACDTLANPVVNAVAKGATAAATGGLALPALIQ